MPPVNTIATLIVMIRELLGRRSDVDREKRVRCRDKSQEALSGRKMRKKLH